MRRRALLQIREDSISEINFADKMEKSWADDPDLTYEDRHRIAKAAKQELEFVIQEWHEERKQMIISITALTASVSKLEEALALREKTIEALTISVANLNKFLAAGTGSLDLLFLLAKVAGAVTVVFGAMVAIVLGIRTIK